MQARFDSIEASEFRTGLRHTLYRDLLFVLPSKVRDRIWAADTANTNQLWYEFLRDELIYQCDTQLKALGY